MRKYNQKDKIYEAIKNSEFYFNKDINTFIFKYLVKNKNPYKDYNCRTKSIFTHIPKAAGSSIANGLYQNSSSHIPLARYFYFDKVLFDTYYKFSFVRNPFDRIYSAFNFLKAKEGREFKPLEWWVNTYLSNQANFESFVLKISRDASYKKVILSQTHFRPQYQWVCFPKSTQFLTNFIGKFENLEEDLKLVTDHLNLDYELPHLKKTSFQTYKLGDIYTKEMKLIVYELYKIDCELFEYGFD